MSATLPDGKTERRAKARTLDAVASPLGSVRGLNRSPSRSHIPASPCGLAMLACDDRRSASGSHRFRVALLPRQPRRSGAGGPDAGFL